MADHSSIEWTDATWNPITGCSIVSPGCVRCYAMKLAGTRLKHIDSRKGLTRETAIGPVWTGEVRLNEQWLDQPLRWKQPRRIFVCAHGDLFAENVPDEWIDRVFAVMALAPQHTFQVLTKRAKRMREYVNGTRSSVPFLGRMPLERIHLEASGHMEGDGGFMDTLKRHGNVYSLYCSVPWPLPNVWLGVSAERQQEADDRVPELLATPAAIRFVSAEPLLGPIRFDRIGEFLDTFEDCGGHPDPHWPATSQDATWLNALVGRMQAEARDPYGKRLGDIDVGLRHEGGKLDWIIVGGESGQNARPMHPDWARSIRNQCAAAGVPFFFKQWGAWRETDWQLCAHPLPAGTIAPAKPYWMGAGYGLDRPSMSLEQVGKKAAGRLLDGREHSEFPKVAA
ncbi:MAG: phage Gp37/Gp68 family protein [Mesorhizobium sp.]|uniref:phage Gp37/Gp68 family protein n=1 Tax=Mesorhizobium sp. TaxID=1871066 RepID=UPI00120AF13F|nr:phage Gp37/Gp68 family protein [Mesorhizobium sp.]TIT24447.1 MAG: phage Gp37/Gp68 family protein [Mesorhizobium sp.]